MYDIILEHLNHIYIVHILMVKLRNKIPAANYRIKTPLKGFKRNVTRWSSKFQILCRYQDIRKFIPLMDVAGVRIVLPSNADNISTDDITGIFQHFDSVSK